MLACEAADIEGHAALLTPVELNFSDSETSKTDTAGDRKQRDKSKVHNS